MSCGCIGTFSLFVVFNSSTFYLHENFCFFWLFIFFEMFYFQKISLPISGLCVLPNRVFPLSKLPRGRTAVVGITILLASSKKYYVLLVMNSYISICNAKFRFSSSMLLGILLFESRILLHRFSQVMSMTTQLKMLTWMVESSTHVFSIIRFSFEENW